MRIVCIGGGPAGLYFALLMKQLGPHHDITVVERNRPYDTFGWGVVFSDATMDNMRRWDKESADSIEQSFAHWDDIELQFKGRVIRSGGPIATAISHVLGLAADATIELNLHIRNSAVSEFKVTPKRHTLISFNTLPNLDAPDHAGWVTYP